MRVSTTTNVTVIPTTIDLARYKIVPKPRNEDVPVIGWTGTFSTVPYLDLLRDVFRELARRRRFKLRVVGVPYAIDGLPFETVPWRSETEADDLRPLDIGVMPLTNDRWSQGKCGCKALQYMALGVPAVCSPKSVLTR